MVRTTLDIDPSVLEEAKALARTRGVTLGETVSALVARALADVHEPVNERPFRWHSQDMGLKVDLEDKYAVWQLLDEEEIR
jgi:hypothetical protein